VITNEKNELIPTTTITGWYMCIDYRKLNSMTRKDHFPLPFMAIQVTTKLKLHWKIKRRLLSHVHSVLLHIEGCLLDYVMHQPRFKYACLAYLVIWLNVFLRFLWMIFLFWVIHLMTI